VFNASLTNKNRYGAKGHPWRIPHLIGKASVFMPLMQTVAWTLANKSLTKFTKDAGTPIASKMQKRKDKYTLSNAFLKLSLKRIIGWLDSFAHVVVSWRSRMLSNILQEGM